MNNENNIQGASALDIPVPPGGGSWTFDEVKWKWVSNDPAPTEEAIEAATASASEQPASLNGEE